MKNTPNQYLVRISIFLVLILAIVIFVYPVLQSAFLSNIYINAIIIFSLIFGLFFNIYNLIQLQNDHSNLASFIMLVTNSLMHEQKKHGRTRIKT